MQRNKYMRRYFAKQPERRAWDGLKQRASNPKNPGWDNYGGRGISVCRGIDNSFPYFLEIVGTKPTPSHSIDRIDNDKGYWCGKCAECLKQGYVLNLRWSDRIVQKQNQRTYRNNSSGRKGVTRSYNSWQARIGVGGKLIQLGCFKEYSEAVKARELAELKYFNK